MNLKQIRKSKGLTQQEVANYIGISQNNYSYWENGKVKIDNKSLQKLSELFNVSIDTIIGNNQLINLDTKEQWFSSLTSLQKTLVNVILNLNEIQQHKVLAYVQGLND